MLPLKSKIDTKCTWFMFARSANKILKFQKAWLFAWFCHSDDFNGILLTFILFRFNVWEQNFWPTRRWRLLCLEILEILVFDPKNYFEIDFIIKTTNFIPQLMKNDTIALIGVFLNFKQAWNVVPWNSCVIHSILVFAINLHLWVQSAMFREQLKDFLLWNYFKLRFDCCKVYETQAEGFSLCATLNHKARVFKIFLWSRYNSDKISNIFDLKFTCF